MSAATTLSGDETAHRDALRLGASEADDGHPELAEPIFRRVYEETRGTGMRAERLACSHLMTLFARQERDLETLIVARRLVHLAAAAGDTESTCFGWVGLSDAFIRLGDTERADDAAAHLDAALERYDGISRVPLRRTLLRVRVDSALALDDVPAARAAVDRIAGVDPGTTEPPTQGRCTLLAHAEVALREGRPELAREFLGRIALLATGAETRALDAACCAVKCALAIDGPAAALALVATALDLLDSPAALVHGAAHRMRCARELGDLIVARCDDPEAATRAYDIAATAVLARGAEIHRAVRAFPELVHPEEEDAATLLAYRRRFAAAQRDLHAAVARLIRARIEAGNAPTWARGLTPGALGVCAWCLRVQMPDGTMLPLGHFVSSDPTLRISHGMCPTCHDQIRASIAESRPAGAPPQV